MGIHVGVTLHFNRTTRKEIVNIVYYRRTSINSSCLVIASVETGVAQSLVAFRLSALPCATKAVSILLNGKVGVFVNKYSSESLKNRLFVTVKARTYY